MLAVSVIYYNFKIVISSHVVDLRHWGHMTRGTVGKRGTVGPLARGTVGLWVQYCRPVGAVLYACGCNTVGLWVVAL